MVETRAIYGRKSRIMDIFDISSRHRLVPCAVAYPSIHDEALGLEERNLKLTTDQAIVLELRGNGMTNKEIGDVQGKTTNAINHHIKRL